MVIAYEKYGSVYYDFGIMKSNLVSTQATLVSVSGNWIVYEKNGHIYKAEVNSNGYIKQRDVLVR